MEEMIREFDYYDDYWNYFVDASVGIFDGEDWDNNIEALKDLFADMTLYKNTSYFKKKARERMIALKTQLCSRNRNKKEARNGR